MHLRKFKFLNISDIVWGFKNHANWIEIYPYHRSRGVTGQLKLRYVYWDQEPLVQRASRPLIRLELAYAQSLVHRGTWGKLIWSRSTSEHLASYFHWEFLGPWKFWRFNRSRNLPWREVYAEPSRRRCSQLTTNRHPMSKPSDLAEFRGIYTIESLPHGCKS